MRANAAVISVLQRPFQLFRQQPQLKIVGLVAVIIGYLSLSPTLMLLYGSFLSKPLGVPGNFTLAHYIEAYTDPLTYRLLFNSFVFAAGSSLLSTGLAAFLAWTAVRTNAPLENSSSLPPSFLIFSHPSCWPSPGRCF